VALELGGKSANIIFADADLSNAALQGVLGMQGSGQGCINGTRVLVERSVYDDVLQLISGILSGLEVGDPLVMSTFFGPVVSEPAADRIMAVIEAAKNSGTRLVCGGERLGGDLADGYFIAPNGIRRCRQLHNARPRRDLRARRRRAAVRRRGRSRPHRQ